MRLVRTILALAIAASLALLPVGASAAGLAMAPADAGHGMHMDAAADMSATMSMDPCCPDDMNGTAPHTDGYKCAMGVCCAGAVAMGAVEAVRFTLLSVGGSRIALPADQIVAFRGGSPPFRPPRV